MNSLTNIEVIRSKLKNSGLELNHSDFLNGMWPLLCIGKIFGLIPLERIRSETKFSCKSFACALSFYSWFSYMTVFIFAVIIFVRDLQGDDVNLVEQFLDMVYHFHITAIISLCIIQSRNFPSVFSTWYQLECQLKKLEKLDRFDSSRTRYIEVSKELQKKEKPLRKIRFHEIIPFYAYLEKKAIDLESLDKTQIMESKFVLNCWFITGGYFLLTLIGAIAYFVGIGVREKTETFSAYLEAVAVVYVLEELVVWWTGFYVLIIGHIMEIAWAYGDMLIFMFSYAMNHHYKRFNKVLEVLQYCHPSIEELETLRSLHWNLAIAIKKTDGCLGKVILVSFACNILYLFSRVYIGLAEDLSSPDPRIVFEASYAFAYLIWRIFSSATAASKLNEETTKTLKILLQFKQPIEDETYILLMDRFVNQSISGNIVLTGDGYFNVNRSFITSLISAIVTYEIIIIQNSSS